MEQWKLSRQGIIRLGEYRHHLQPPGWNPDDTDAQMEGLLKALNGRSRRPGIWYAYLLRTAYFEYRPDPAIIISPPSILHHSLLILSKCGLFEARVHYIPASSAGI